MQQHTLQNYLSLYSCCFLPLVSRVCLNTIFFVARNQEADTATTIATDTATTIATHYVYCTPLLLLLLLLLLLPLLLLLLLPL